MEEGKARQVHPPPTHFLVPADWAQELVEVYVHHKSKHRSDRKKNKLKKSVMQLFLPMYATVKVPQVQECVEEEE